MRLLAFVVLACASPPPAGSGEGAGASSAGTAPSGTGPCAADAAGAPEPVAAFLPRDVPGFCLDPHASVRAFDAATPGGVERGVERLLGAGGSDAAAGRDQVLALRYLARDGGGAADVVVSRFEDAGLAYAHFSERLLGDGDPARLTATGLDSDGVAVLDAPYALAWRGRHVLWSRHVNVELPPSEEREAAARLLPGLVRALVRAIPPDEGLPSALRRLPETARLPLAMRWSRGDALGVPGLGRGAVGHYRDGSKRWRVLALERPDAESAKDVLATLRRHPQVRKIKNAPLDAVELSERRLPSEPVVHWVIGQRGEMIYGIGDEPSALPEFMPARAEESVKLSRYEKLVLLTKVHLK